MATIKVDRGFTQKIQQKGMSYKPGPLPPTAPKGKKPKGGLSGLTVALIVVGAVLFIAAVGIVVALTAGGKPDQAKPGAPVQPAVAVPAAPAPAAVAAPPAAVSKKPVAAPKPPARPTAIQAQVRSGFSGPGAGFVFEGVPPPAANDAAATAQFALVDSELDRSSGGPAALNDGRLPPGLDQPKNNFLFRAGTDGGRLLVDLGRAVSIKQVNTYSGHSEMRGAQVYVLYVSDGESDDFVVDPARGVDPATVGWRRVASADTRSLSAPGGGQHGVSIAAEEDTLGSFRFLLFAVSATEMSDDRGNTFYSEIDVIDADSRSSLAQAKVADSAPLIGEREVPMGSPQGLLCEYYENIQGNLVDDLRRAPNYPAKPDRTVQVKRFELSEKRGEQYGARVRGYVVPPKTGAYTFLLNVDDGGEFWLSTDESPANLQKRITLTKHTNRKWTSFAEQQSAPCELVGGKRYYLEAFVKQSSGGDYLAVGWFGPVSDQICIIESQYLQPWTGASN